MPAMTRRDELEARLETKIDRLSETVQELRNVATRIEASQEQAKVAASAANVRMDSTDSRVKSLEATRDQAKGAAWATRIVWVIVLALLGAFEYLQHGR